MHQSTLKEIISWIAINGAKAYSAETISRDLNIPIDESFHSADSVISTVLLDAFKAAKLTTGIDASTSADEFFDVTLTLLENLSDYKSDFQIIFNPKNLGVESFSFAPILSKLTQELLKSNIETFLDKLTYSVIICSILYEWLHDQTPDLASTSDKLNQVAHTIFDCV